MSEQREPRRLVERDAVPRELERTARVLRRLPPTAAVPRAQVDATWDAVIAQTMVRQTRPRWAPIVAVGFAAACAAVLVFAVVAGRSPDAPMPVAKSAPWQPQAGAQLIAATAESPARLVHGKVQGQPMSGSTVDAEVLATPHGSVSWRDARFLLDVTSERTLLFVESGEAVWRGAAGERVLGAGAELRAPPLVQALPPSADCPSSPVAERVACLERISRGAGLAAENALFELGWVELHERASADAALQRWSVYLARFPEGTLEAEARAMRVLTLAERGRTADARAELRRFHEALPDSPLLTPLDSAMKLSAGSGTSAVQTGPEGTR